MDPKKTAGKIVGKLKNSFKFTKSKRRSLYGYLFISPFLIGFIILFLVPFFQSAYFSVNRLQITRTGYELHYVGLENFNYAFFVDPDFVQVLTTEIIRIFYQLPMIIIFSFFAAAVLNQKFRGRMLARAIFFLPVILGSAIMLEIQQGDLAMQMMAGVQETGEGARQVLQNGEGGILGTQAFEAFLMNLRMPEVFIEYIVEAVNNVPEIINASAIQILIFLAGLQSVPSALYESADVEGATGWEKFWMITFPMLTPVILINVIYTIIDQFVGETAGILGFINAFIFGVGYGRGTAMAVVYFTVIGVILLVVGFIVSRYVFYHDF